MLVHFRQKTSWAQSISVQGILYVSQFDAVGHFFSESTRLGQPGNARPGLVRSIPYRGKSVPANSITQEPDSSPVY
jgi:hypothetical protein